MSTNQASNQAKNDKNWSGAPIRLTSLPTLTFFIGLVVLFVGERAIGDSGSKRQIADILAGLLLVGGFFWRAQQMSGAKDPSQKSAEGWLLACSGAILFGIGLYFAFSLGKDSLHDSLGKGFDRMDGINAILWPVLITGGALPL